MPEFLQQHTASTFMYLFATQFYQTHEGMELKECFDILSLVTSSTVGAFGIANYQAFIMMGYIIYLQLYVGIAAVCLCRSLRRKMKASAAT